MSCTLQTRRFFQDFYVVWLDENHENYRKSIIELKQLINNVDIFVDIDECIDFITDRPNKTAFMITSNKYIQQLLPVAKDISQLKSIYIFCQGNKTQANWSTECSKIFTGFTDIVSISEAIKQTLKDDEHNEVSISVSKSEDETSDTNKNVLDCTFMYTQILKEILLTIDFNQKYFEEFLKFCRDELANDNKELRNVDKIQNEYYQHKPIWWYTRQSFLYSMVNKALRLMDIDNILKMGFFICDLHKNIADLHAEQFEQDTSSGLFTVYRGQGLSQVDFDQIRKSRDRLLAFNNFLSTSKNRQVSLNFINRTVIKTSPVPILFVMHIDSSIRRTPFANVVDVSAIKREEEVLFSMHSVFRIGATKKLHSDNRIWEVELVFTGENDPDLHVLTDNVRKQTAGLPGLYRLAQLMITIGRFDKAEEFYQSLLTQTKTPNERAVIFHQFGLIRALHGKYDEALEYSRKSLEIMKQSLPADHPTLATSYNNIGMAYEKMGEYSQALQYLQKSLEIMKKSLSADHPDLAASYNNIGLIYDSMNDYSQALQYHQKSLEIMKKSLPADHPTLATCYNNIGVIYEKMGEYSQALQYSRKSLEIRKQSLPADHPTLATSYNNIGMAYEKMGEYSQALEYHQKSVEIMKQSLPVDHPDLATCYNNIGVIYEKMGEYSQALQYSRKSLEIRKQSLPADHPTLATSYNNIGMVYEKMGEYSQALQYLQKSLEIMKKSLSADHPDLAASYNNIGLIYDSMNDYSQALQYHQKSLEIMKKSLPADHPDLATSYNNIGMVYEKMGEYSQALQYHQKSLEIMKKSLPADHPDLATSYNNIGLIYYYKKDYKRALEYLELALAIMEKSLVSNHSNIKTIKKSIEIVRKKS